jgi:hypothetical protein
VSRAQTATVATTPDIGAALGLAQRIMSENRDPSADESAAIDAARDVADPAAKEMFVVWVRFTEIRAEIRRAADQRAQDARVREEKRAHWMARPARWRALDPQERLWLTVGAAVPESERIRGSDLRQIFIGLARDVRDGVDVVPWLFEESLVQEARRLGFSREGQQLASEGVTS